MAQLDVSDVLLDPDFIDKISLVHRSTTVNSRGENILSETCFNTVGSVQPVTGKEFMRVPDDLRTSDVRSFYIKAEIISDGSCQYPDLILFQGQRFQILNVMPWLNWGQGWNQGLCVRQAASA